MKFRLEWVDDEGYARSEVVDAKNWFAAVRVAVKTGGTLMKIERLL